MGFDVVSIPTMPEEYKGKSLKKGDYTKTTPQKWTEKEIEWLLDLRNKGFSTQEIAQSMGRSEVSVQIKSKRLQKKTKHIQCKSH